MKILVVDDEDIVLESCKRVLEDCFEVILARSADAALEAIRRQTIGMILLDIKMPDKEGMSLLREVKEKWPNIPVIIMSGYTTTETVEQVSRTEAAAFIAKPFTPDELVEAVAKVIEEEGKPLKKERLSNQIHDRSILYGPIPEDRGPVRGFVHDCSTCKGFITSGSDEGD